MKKNKFFLFDIDGTLLHVHSGFMVQLIQQLIQKLGKENIVMDSESFAGRTDKDIFLKLMRLNEVPESYYADLRQLYISDLDSTLTAADVSSIQGVTAALHYFDEQDFNFGLLTGNFKESAFIKLNRAGLDSFFDFGAFGCNHANRNDLPEIAYEYAKSSYGTSFEPADLVIIGDTPKDIACAKHFGATSVAVSTGSFSSKELAVHQPDLLLSSLEHPYQWISRLP
jgi:phosphoglycolate phosphatase-like HAD superfamily hydrolase